MSSEWREARLSELCSVITDGAHKSPPTVSTGMPMASVKDLTRHGIRYQTARHISLSDYEELQRSGCCPRVGDVLIAKDGNSALETVCVHADERDICLLSSVAIFRPGPDLDSSFLKYFLESPQTKYILKGGYISGSAIPRVVLRDFKMLPVFIPSKQEQVQICSVLAPLDDKIEQNRKTSETLEGIAKALFKSWFLDFDPVRAKAEGRPTGLPNEISELFPDSFEESELGEIPSGWSVKKIGDVVIRLPVGQKFDKKTVFPSGVVPVLDQSSDGIIGFHDQAPGVLASENDPLFTFANHTCSMRFMMESFSVIQNVFPLKGKDVSTDWLYQATLGKQVITEYKGHYPDLVDREIVVPNKGLDLVFGGVFRSFARSQLANKKQSSTLKRLRDALLPRLISGELRVPDAEKMLEEVGV